MMDERILRQSACWHGVPHGVVAMNFRLEAHVAVPYARQGLKAIHFCIWILTTYQVYLEGVSWHGIAWGEI